LRRERRQERACEVMGERQARATVRVRVWRLPQRASAAD
jgi:hypothetical protein